MSSGSGHWPSLLRNAAGGHHRSPSSQIEGIDWSRDLASVPTAQSLFSEALLDNIVLPGEVSTLAFDPIQGYMAVGTLSGSVHLFGSPAVSLSWTLRPCQPVKFLLFKPGTPLLVCADAKENVSIYDLSRPDPAAQAKSHANNRRGSLSQAGNLLQPHPDTPTRVAALTARNSITTLTLSPSHAHLFIGLRDGTVDTYDLDRLCSSPYRIPNCWLEEEELLRRSGVPDAPRRRHVPLVVDIAISPKDLNILLLAYEGGACLLDIKERSVLASFQLRLLPGAPGAGGIAPEAIWTERGSPVTCVAWRPDGQIFAMGHEDGLISFWSAADDSKPLLVRSLAELDLDRPTVDELPGRPPREPIFKLAWSGFPGKRWLDALSGGKADEQMSAADVEGGSTILTVLGGAVPNHDPPGVMTLHFPPYVATAPSSATTTASFWGSAAQPAHEVAHKARPGLRASLTSTRETRVLSNATVQDFILLPRSSPHYSMAYDPMAILMLVDVPHGLPPLAPPAAQRGLVATPFPPLPSPGAHRASSGPRSPGLIPRPADGTSPSQAVAGPTPAIAPDLVAPKLLTLPFALACTGAGAVLSAQLVNLPVHSYRKLVSVADGQEGSPDGSSGAPSLPLKGGAAAAATIGNLTPEALARTPGSFRLLITQHLDGSIRFADASQHLVLLPSTGPPQQPTNEAGQPTGPPPPAFLDRPFPMPLPHLTISPQQTLSHPSMAHHPRATRLLSDPRQLRVREVHFASEVLEVSAILAGGLVLHYRYGLAKFSQSSEVQAEISEEMQREREGAEAAAFTHVRQDAPHRVSISSPQSNNAEAQLYAEKQDVEVGAMLENDMQRAMRDLDLGSRPPSTTPMPPPGMPTSTSSGSIGGPPPPRPKRDPNRGSIMSRLGGSKRSSAAGSEGSPRASVSSPPPSHATQLFPPTGSSDAASISSSHFGDEFTSLDATNDWSLSGFKATHLLDLGRGDVTCLAHSNIGFLALACGAGLAIVDLRGPEVLMSEGMGGDFSVGPPTSQGKSGMRARRAERKLLEAESSAPVTGLTWTVCRLAGAQPSTHAGLAPRLVVARANGTLTVWTLVHTLEMWIPERTGATKIDDLDSHGSLAASSLSVLDVAGNVAPANPAELQRSIRDFSRSTGTEEALESDLPLLLGWTGKKLFVTAGLLGGSVVGHVDTTEPILAASIVERHGDRVVVAVSKTSVRIYSAPRLELITRVQRHYHDHSESSPTSTSSASIDAGPAGAWLERLSTLDVRLWTFMGHAPRAAQPSLLLWVQGKALPAHPSAGAVGSITSWFSTKAATTSALDDVLAGPSRAAGPAITLPPVKTKEDFVASITPGLQEVPLRNSDSPAPAGAGAPSSSSARPRQPHASAATLAESQSAASTMWANMDLAKARGEAMQGLENSLSSLETSANNWLKETKAGLVKSAARDKLGKLF
ncbi:hypothetical protein BDZ90DRAFT_234681 [Jaminaea rosea]|uniref:Lethal giant larvae (Lgl)-like C-terminal domain-containing protein n=1 Tax=Jaminaea rosea TaxID=1569628 RepID=A0A316UHH2_9BASI|nr:hypothetical protein BDZ90DRAFT_234681 [Jaminaea rosea]PWN24726.1 hypothetical protein BDZ90DRAFT_234681 [Jaminaea rosea]